ncbi:HNH endonuclease [Streptomyces osmaniensis]|uniref:HNH nuclease domain-containing protein n=1 Tax=Streptomyces osmaniensis TaxID=593134 RepID=A0ABP6UVI3_9ACTN
MGNGHGHESIFDIDAGDDRQRGEGPAGHAETDSVQWVLQPRGSAKMRGPQHFDHSVRRGIRLKDYEGALGGDADQLKRIFPDGVARLWGSTPTQHTGNAKAVALRNRKVGDEVLFYAQNTFIARASILGLLHNRDLAAAVWGVDEETQSTWEHIMALGDVVEFQVPAQPILTALAMTPPLRSLTLVRAAERRRHLRLLEGQVPAAAKRPSGERESATPAQAMGRAELLTALGTLDADVPDEGRTRHGSLTLLWAIGRLVSGQGRLAPADVCRSQLEPILEEFGAPGVSVSLEYSFRHLRDSGLWDVVGTERRRPDPVALAASVESGAQAGLRREAARLLRQPLARAEAIGLLCTTYFENIDQLELLERVGLGGYAHASGADEGDGERDGDGEPARPRGRRQVTSSRPDRDQRLANRVKLLHLHQCQVCGLRLDTRFGHYSEAAHIRGLGSPHDGPEVLSNLLCLCPNHHVQFDTLSIFIDEHWNVRRSRDRELISPLTRHPEHAIDEECVEYHRALCGRSRYSLDSG